MKIILTIAWRNIRQHKVKTLIIGLIMVIGIMVLVVGLTPLWIQLQQASKNRTSKTTQVIS